MHISFISAALYGDPLASALIHPGIYAQDSLGLIVLGPRIFTRSSGIECCSGKCNPPFHQRRFDTFEVVRDPRRVFEDSQVLRNCVHAVRSVAGTPSVPVRIAIAALAIIEPCIPSKLAGCLQSIRDLPPL